MIVALAAATGASAWVVLGSADDDGTTPAVGDRAGRPAGPASSGCRGALPPLPPVFGVQPTGGTARGRGSAFRLIERGRPVANVLALSTRVDVESILRTSETQLRASGRPTRRIMLGRFAAVLSPASDMQTATAITRGPCRSYSVVAADERSARGVALALVTAEVRHAGPQPPETPRR